MIRWWRAVTPSNSLAAVYGIAADCAAREVLGGGVAIDITAIDETNMRVDIPALIEEVSPPGAGSGWAGGAGGRPIQSISPRAGHRAAVPGRGDIGRDMGGFHVVHGCLSMLDGKAAGDLDACREMGISMFAGEAEGRFDQVLRDAAGDGLRPLYNYLNDLPGLQATPVPFLPRRYVSRTIGHSTTFDAGRGCPYQCSFCTIINVQGRKSRFRSPDDVEKLVRLNWANGISKFFITDDNFARNREWEAIFDRLIRLREVDGIPLGLMIQVDTLCHKLSGFVEKAKRAGVTRVFIGLENINPDNLAGAKKKQNKITEYRRMLLAWKEQGVITIAGYILGFPADTPQTIRRDIAIIQKELPLDAGLRVLLPDRRCRGRRTTRFFWKNGVAMDADLNAYDVEHVCTGHAKMSRQEWQDIYQEAWGLYYSADHMKTLLRRAAATGVSLKSLIKLLVTFSSTVRLECVHPLQSGIVRMRHPSERRPGRSAESSFVFWPRLIWTTLKVHVRLARLIAEASRCKRGRYGGALAPPTIWIRH